MERGYSDVFAGDALAALSRNAVRCLAGDKKYWHPQEAASSSNN